MNYISTNIKVLREEARLTITELSEIVNIDVEKLKSFEKGKINPTEEELILLCKPLRISYEDMIERDILSERNEAGKRMRFGKDRNNYNWYLGDRKKFGIYFGYFIGILVFFITLTVIFKVANVNYLTREINELTGELVFKDATIWTSLTMAYLYTVYPAGICIFIWLLTKLHYRFAWWHIFWWSFIIAIIGILGFVGILPSLGYSFYKSVIKKGKN